MQRSFVLGASLLFASSLALAQTHGAPYTINLADGSQIFSKDAPVQRGSVMTFHPYPSGTLTGVPAELVVGVAGSGKIAKSAKASRPAAGTAKARPALEGGVRSGLEPGDVLVLGPTGAGAANSQAVGAPAAGAAAANTGGSGGAVDPNNPNAANPNLVLNPNGTTLGSDGVQRAMSSTDLSRGLDGQAPVGPNGFPANATGAPTVIGPNGTPTLAPGVPGSSTPVIGTNGAPVLGTTAPAPVIGLNGTPVTAPSGQPGSATAQPVIGPNGTPVLAQPGQPGSTPPTIGPNGTPVLAQPGQPGSAAPNTAPNGTPNTAAPQGGPAQGGAPQGGAAPQGGSSPQ